MSCAERFDVVEQGLHNRAFRLDETNCQRWIRPPFANQAVSSNLMSVSKLLEIETIRENLRRAMLAKDAKPTTLSLKVGRNRTLVKDLLEKSQDIQISTLTKLAGALDIPLSDLLAAPRISIVGRIGAGGTIIFEDLGNEEKVMRPPGVSGTLVALIVEGSSMLPKYRDGDIIYIHRDHDGVLASYVGDDCAVRLTTGETYIKQLVKGSVEDRWTLISLNAPPMEDVEIEWATPVRFIMPARSRHLFS